MIKVLIYKQGNKIKSRHCTAPDGAHLTTNSEVFDMIREYPNHDVKFLDKNNNHNDITHEELIKIIFSKERTLNPTDLDLNYILRQGGLTKYIKQLEDPIDILFHY